MKSLRKLLKRFHRNERGLELSEYAVMIALVIAIAVVTIGLVGTQINTIFDSLLSALGG